MLPQLLQHVRTRRDYLPRRRLAGESWWTRACGARGNRSAWAQSLGGQTRRRRSRRSRTPRDRNAGRRCSRAGRSGLGRRRITGGDDMRRRLPCPGLRWLNWRSRLKRRARDGGSGRPFRKGNRGSCRCRRQRLSWSCGSRQRWHCSGSIGCLALSGRSAQRRGDWAGRYRRSAQPRLRPGSRLCQGRMEGASAAQWRPQRLKFRPGRLCGRSVRRRRNGRFGLLRRSLRDGFRCGRRGLNGPDVPRRGTYHGRAHGCAQRGGCLSLCGDGRRLR